MMQVFADELYPVLFYHKAALRYLRIRGVLQAIPVPIDPPRTWFPDSESSPESPSLLPGYTHGLISAYSPEIKERNAVGGAISHVNMTSATLSGPLAPPPAATLPEKPLDSQDALLQDIEPLNVLPLWTRMARLNPPVPAPKAVPHKFRYDRARSKLTPATRR